MALQEEFEREGNWLFRHRSYLPLLLLGACLGIYVNTIRTQSHWFMAVLPHWQWYELGCLCIGMCGAAIRAYTVGYTPSGTSGRNTTGQVADTLNVTGAYSIVRHPLYVGNFLMWFSLALLTCNLPFMLFFVLAYWLYYERIMYAEEQFLRRKFGLCYLQWAARTPAFIPAVGHYVPASTPFSWKKVMIKEKNGIFALFLLFAVFNGIGACLTHIMPPNVYLYGAALALGAAYVSIRLWKRSGRSLNVQLP